MEQNSYSGQVPDLGADLIARHVGDPILVVSREKKVLYANRSARQLLGIHEDADLGSSRCCDLLKMSLCEGGCPSEKISNKCQVVFDYFVRREGVEAVFCVTTSILPDAEGNMLGVIHAFKSMELLRDIIDEQHRTQQSLLLSQHKIEAILDSIADGVFTVDKAGTIIHFGKSMERITGWSEKEVLGRTCAEVLRGNLCRKDCPIDWSLGEHAPVEKSREILRARDGHEIPVFVATSPLRDATGLIGIVCSVNDRTEVEDLRRELGERTLLPQLVGRGPAMQRLLSLVESVSGTDVTVLVTGETGTGKELVARGIHERSPRAQGPFVAVNCSSLSPTLLESELFGHAKGSFTGAIRDHKGKFELAEGGTVFLDEISEVSPEIQVKLLRFLQEREIERVGESTARKVDVRIIAATNRDLTAMVEGGTYRSDLYYRLNVFPVRVPPLRERREDIPLLVEHFIRKHRRLKESIEGVSSRAFRILAEHPWPGNVRELENVIMYAMTASPGKRIERAHLPPDVRAARPIVHRKDSAPGNLDPVTMEKARIIRILGEHSWHVGEAAVALGYSRVTLWRRMKRLGIQLPSRSEATSVS